MILLVLVLLGIVLAFGARRGYRPALWVLRLWRSLRAYLVTAPATFIYLLIVLVTTWVVVTSSTQIGDVLLESHSSSLRVLAASPFRGLVQSAFWLESGWELPLAVAFAVLLAPVEQWLGTLRWLIVATIGHVGTTLLVSVIVWYAVTAQLVVGDDGHGVDVGVSYAFGAVAGILTFRLPGRSGLLYAAVVLAALLLILGFAPSFTAVGHCIAFLIGIALHRLAREPGIVTRASGPLYPRPLWRP